MSDSQDLKQKQYFYKKAPAPNSNIAWAHIAQGDTISDACEVSLLDNVFGVYKTKQFENVESAISYLIDQDYKDFDMREKVAMSDDVTSPKPPFNKSPILLDNYWCKVIGLGERNWAAIIPSNGRFEVVFFMDDSCIFDKMNFFSQEQAISALEKNEFSLYKDDDLLQQYVQAPQHPFGHTEHPSGKIYSSGKYWLQ